MINASVIQKNVGMLVGTVVMDREDIVPLIAILTAVKEMLGPFHGNVAHLIDSNIRRKRQQHMRGKAKLGCSAPGLCPVLNDA